MSRRQRLLHVHFSRQSDQPDGEGLVYASPQVTCHAGCPSGSRGSRVTLGAYIVGQLKGTYFEPASPGSPVEQSDIAVNPRSQRRTGYCNSCGAMTHLIDDFLEEIGRRAITWANSYFENLNRMEAPLLISPHPRAHALQGLSLAGSHDAQVALQLILDAGITTVEALTELDEFTVCRLMLAGYGRTERVVQKALDRFEAIREALGRSGLTLSGKRHQRWELYKEIPPSS